MQGKHYSEYFFYRKLLNYDRLLLFIRKVLSLQFIKQKITI